MLCAVPARSLHRGMQAADNAAQGSPVQHIPYAHHYTP